MVLQILDELHQPWATHTSSTTWTTPPTKVCYSILEKLYSKSWAKATRQDVNTSRCLNEKWQPHFELKRWVWPMIKWSHLTPKSIYSHIGDFVADHLYMKFSCVLLRVFAFVSFIFVSPFKKENFIYISFCLLCIFCIQFIVYHSVNSLQIFVRSF